MSEFPEVEQCECGFWCDIQSPSCPDCGRVNHRIASEAATLAADFHRASKRWKIAGGVAVLSAVVLAVIWKTPPTWPTLSAWAATALGLAGCWFYQIKSNGLRTQYHQSESEIAERTWQRAEHKLSIRLGLLEERQQALATHSEQVRQSIHVSPAMQEKLLGTLAAARETVGRLRPRLEQQLRLFPFLRWQNRWLPLMKQMGRLNNSEACELTLDYLAKLRAAAANLPPDLTELPDAMRDLDRLEATVSKRMKALRGAELVSKTVELVQDLQPIEVDLPNTGVDAPTAITLESFPWFYETADITAQAEELEDELRRLQSELAVEEEFPMEERIRE